MTRGAKLTALVAISGWIVAVGVWASPPSSTRDTLFYSGVLDGVVGSTASITVEFVGDGNQVRCTTNSAATAIDSAGAFQIPLETSCNTAIDSDEDLRVRLTVNGNVLSPEQPLGSAPDALRASNAAGPLATLLDSIATRLSALEARVTTTSFAGVVTANAAQTFTNHSNFIIDISSAGFVDRPVCSVSNVTTANGETLVSITFAEIVEVTPTAATVKLIRLDGGPAPSRAHIALFCTTGN